MPLEKTDKNYPLHSASASRCLLKFSFRMNFVAFLSNGRLALSPSSRPPSGSSSFRPSLRLARAEYPTSLRLLAALSNSRCLGVMRESTGAGGPLFMRRIALSVSSPRRSRSFSRVLFRIFSRRASNMASTNFMGNEVLARAYSRCSLSEIASRRFLIGLSRVKGCQKWKRSETFDLHHSSVSEKIV